MSSGTYPDATRWNDLSPTIVVYHHLSEDEDDLVSHIGVRTRPEVFQTHLAYYRRNFDIIGQSDLLDGRMPRRPLLITFDDLYKSVLDVAGPLLRDANAPSMLFLNPASILTQTLPFDNLFSLALEKLGGAQIMSLLGAVEARVPPATQIISRLMSRLTPDRLHNVRSLIVQALGRTEAELRADTQMFMTARDVAGLSDFGIDVGNHSMGHTFFRSLSPSQLVEEITGGKALIEEMTSQSVRCLSIPYGNECDATPQALAIARSSGHQATFLVHGRSNRRRIAPDVFYRTSPREVKTWLLPLVLGGLPHLRGLIRSRRCSAMATRILVPAC